MPKKPSRLQLRANRQNAQLTTGPRTSEGKAKAALNLQKAYAERKAIARQFFIDANAISESERDTLTVMFADAEQQHHPVTDEEFNIIEQMVLNQLQLWRYQSALAVIVRSLIRESTKSLSPCSEERGIESAATQPGYLALSKLIGHCHRLRSRLIADLRATRRLHAESASRNAADEILIDPIYETFIASAPAPTPPTTKNVTILPTTSPIQHEKVG